MKPAIDLLGHSFFSWCCELLDEHTYFDTAACILMRHWIGDVSNTTIYNDIETDCKVHYSHNGCTAIRYVICLKCYSQCYSLAVYGKNRQK